MQECGNDGICNCCLVSAALFSKMLLLSVASSAVRCCTRNCRQQQVMFSAAVLSYFAACFCCHAKGVAAAFLPLLLNYMCSFQTANVDICQLGQLITMPMGQKRGGNCGLLTSNIRKKRKKKRKDNACRRQFNEKPSTLPGCTGNIRNVNGCIDVVDGYSRSRRAR